MLIKRDDQLEGAELAGEGGTWQGASGGWPPLPGSGSTQRLRFRGSWAQKPHSSVGPRHANSCRKAAAHPGGREWPWSTLSESHNSPAGRTSVGVPWAAGSRWWRVGGPRLPWKVGGRGPGQTEVRQAGPWPRPHLAGWHGNNGEGAAGMPTQSISGGAGLCPKTPRSLVPAAPFWHSLSSHPQPQAQQFPLSWPQRAASAPHPTVFHAQVRWPRASSPHSPAG